MQLHYSLPLSVGFFHSTREMSAGSAPKDKTRITNYTKMSAAPGRLAISNIRTHTTSVCIYRLFLCIHLCTYIAEKGKKERSFIDGSLRDRFKAKRQPTDLEITICDEYSFKFISSTAALYFFFSILFMEETSGRRAQQWTETGFSFPPSLLLLFIRIGSSWWLYQTGASANVTAVNEHFFLCPSVCFYIHFLFCFVFYVKTLSAWQSVSLHCQATLVRLTRLNVLLLPTLFKRTEHLFS